MRPALKLLGCFLLVGNSFLTTFTSTGVVLRALAAERQTNTVANASVATDIHQSLDVHGHLGTQRAFDLHLADDATEGTQLVVIPLTHFLVVADTGLVQDLLGGASADTVDVG